MKLYMIEYEVKLKDEKQIVSIKDKMVVPAKSDKGAQSFFLKIVQGTPALLMRYDDQTRIMVPIKDAGEVIVTSCRKL